MADRELPDYERRGLAAFVRRYPQLHQGIGLLGNALFIAGSVFFLLQEQHWGVLAFLSGSVAMFIGQLGDIVRGLGRRRLEHHNIDPWSGH
jgi:hypothetical protein